MPAAPGGAPVSAGVCDAAVPGPRPGPAALSRAQRRSTPAWPRLEIQGTRLGELVGASRRRRRARRPQPGRRRRRAKRDGLAARPQRTSTRTPTSAMAGAGRGKRFHVASSSPGLAAELSSYGVCLYNEGQCGSGPVPASMANRRPRCRGGCAPRPRQAKAPIRCPWRRSGTGCARTPPVITATPLPTT